MATRTSKLILQLVDRVTGPTKQIVASMRQITGLGSGLSFGQAMTRDVKALSAATRDFGRAASLPASMLAALGGRAVYNLQKTGNTIQAVTDITDEQRASLEEYMRALNKDFPFTNAQIAEAALELARAGLTYEQMRGSLRDTLTLSLAGDIDLGHAADLATNIMTAMRMPMETAEQSAASLKRIVDTLTYAANRSNTTVAQMGETFKYVAPIAAAAGLSLEEVSGMSMIMANNGIKAAEAGVAMRSALVSMVKPTKFAMQDFDRLNIDIGDFVKNGRMIKADDIINSLSFDGIDLEPVRKRLDAILSDTALQQSPARLIKTLTHEISSSLGADSIIDKQVLTTSLTDAVTAAGSKVDFLKLMKVLREKGASLNDIANIFNQKQGSRLLTLLTADIDQAVATISQEAPGAGKRSADIQNKGIVGAWNRFAAALENTANVLANTGVLDEVTAVFHGISDALERLSRSNPAMLKLVAYAFLATAALAPLGIAANIAGAGLRVVFYALRLLTTLSIMPAVAAVRALVAAFSGWGAIATGLGFSSVLSMLGASLAALPGIIMGALAPIGAAIAGISAPIWAVIAAVAALALAIYNYWTPISTFVSGFVSVIWDALSGLVSEMAGFGGRIAAAVGSWATEKLIDFGEWLGIDEATMRYALDVAVNAISVSARMIVDTVMAIPAAVVGWVSDIFTMNQYSDEAVASFRSAGEQAGAALVAAIKSAIDGLVSWFTGLPGRIKAAIGSIDFGSLIKWPSMPSWLGGASAKPGIEQRASGGPVRSGGTYLVGEEGPELVTFGRAGFVHDALKTARMVRNAALAASASAAPAFALPDIPVVGPTSQGTSSARGDSARSVEINLGGVTFQIHAAPGQSPEQIADAVERKLSAKLTRLYNGAFHDGVN